MIEPPPVYSSPRQLPAKERSFSLALRSLLGSLAACAGATAGSLGFHHFAWRLRLRHAFFAARLRERDVLFLFAILLDLHIIVFERGGGVSPAPSVATTCR